MRRRWWWSALCAFVLELVVLGALSPGANALTLRGTVSDVVDGDTIKVVARGFETPVRLIGIDTPETRAPGKPVQCFGPAAAVRAKRLLPVGQKVRLVTDPTQDTRDRYARLEVHLDGGGQDYDVMGFTGNQVIHDCLDQYEQHLVFLRRLSEPGVTGGG